jgi:hypothetical protein
MEDNMYLKSSLKSQKKNKTRERKQSKRTTLKTLTMNWRPRSGYMIEIMCVYYIVMKIYVFIYTNNFSPFYFLYITFMQ